MPEVDLLVRTPFVVMLAEWIDQSFAFIWRSQVVQIVEDDGLLPTSENISVKQRLRNLTWGQLLLSWFLPMRENESCRQVKPVGDSHCCLRQAWAKNEITNLVSHKKDFRIQKFAVRSGRGFYKCKPEDKLQHVLSPWTPHHHLRSHACTYQRNVTHVYRGPCSSRNHSPPHFSHQISFFFAASKLTCNRTPKFVQLPSSALESSVNCDGRRSTKSLPCPGERRVLLDPCPAKMISHPICCIQLVSSF